MEHDIEAKLDEIIRRLTRIEARLLEQEGAIMSALDDLTAQVAANASAEASAIQLINGLAAEIAAAANDPVKIEALATQLKTSASALAAAITANTPAAPPPTPVTPPTP